MFSDISFFVIFFLYKYIFISIYSWTGFCQAYTCHMKTCFICQVFFSYMPFIWATLTYVWYTLGICQKHKFSGDSRWWNIQIWTLNVCTSTGMSMVYTCIHKYKLIHINGSECWRGSTAIWPVCSTLKHSVHIIV